MINMMTKTFSAEIRTTVIDDIYINSKDTLNIPNKCGAYILYHTSGKRYIGSTDNLKKRILSHEKRNGVDKVCIYITDNYIDAIILEYMLIKEYEPELNSYGCKRTEDILNDVVDDEEYVQTRVYIKKSAWKLFQAVIALKGKGVGEGFNDVIVNYIKVWNES